MLIREEKGGFSKFKVIIGGEGNLVCVIFCIYLGSLYVDNFIG